jgi:hypothetical protein
MQIGGHRSPCLRSDHAPIPLELSHSLDADSRNCVLTDPGMARWLPSTAVVCQYTLLVAKGFHTTGRASL